MAAWWESFFDDDYLRIWGAGTPEERTRGEAEALWRILGLREGARILDAPCGFGRISKALADRGAEVLGVDQSAPLLAEAERKRGAHPEERLRYRRHDLRQPLSESGFDVALNLFSSLGYGTEEDDLAMLRTLAKAVVPGGKVVVDSMHRDAVAVLTARGAPPGRRDPDGTLVVEVPRFDALAGRVETTWYWSGPKGSGQKSASLRLYCITELVALLNRAGLDVVAAHAGCTTEPYRSEVLHPTRVALVAQRPR